MVSSDACYDAMMLMWVPKEISDSNGSLFQRIFRFQRIYYSFGCIWNITHLDGFGKICILVHLEKPNAPKVMALLGAFGTL